MRSLITAYAFLTALPVFGQSKTAYEVANCNASFLSCSAVGYAAPIGDLGGSSLELAAVILFVLAISLGLVAGMKKKVK